MAEKYPLYMSRLFQVYPSISAGRKHFKKHHFRVLKTKKLIKKFILKNNYNKKN